MLYDGEQCPVWLTCPKCGGEGEVPDWDEMVGWLRCTRCMGEGKAPDRDLLVEPCPRCYGTGSGEAGRTENAIPLPSYASPNCRRCKGSGYHTRLLTRREKIIGFLQLAWPPDAENPRHAPAPTKEKV